MLHGCRRRVMLGKMKLRALILLGGLVTLSTPAFGEAQPSNARVLRRVEKHDQQRSRSQVHTIDGVVIPGRAARPQASIEISVQPFRFPVGTARYSERDQRFLKRGR
jgi:hypothetical protein